jgi:hypothetical protein
MNRVAVFYIAILWLVVPAPDRGDAADRELLLGTVYKDTAFAVSKLSSAPPRICPDVTLFCGPLKVSPDTPYSGNRYEFSQFACDNHPYRWRVVRDMFWGCGSVGARRLGSDIKRIAVEDLPLLDPSNPKRKAQYLVQRFESLSPVIR